MTISPGDKKLFKINRLMSAGGRARAVSELGEGAVLCKKAAYLRADFLFEALHSQWTLERSLGLTGCGVGGGLGLSSARGAILLAGLGLYRGSIFRTSV